MATERAAAFLSCRGLYPERAFSPRTIRSFSYQGNSPERGAEDAHAAAAPTPPQPPASCCGAASTASSIEPSAETSAFVNERELYAASVITAEELVHRDASFRASDAAGKGGDPKASPGASPAASFPDTGGEAAAAVPAVSIPHTAAEPGIYRDGPASLFDGSDGDDSGDGSGGGDGDGDNDLSDSDGSKGKGPAIKKPLQSHLSARGDTATSAAAGRLAAGRGGGGAAAAAPSSGAAMRRPGASAVASDGASDGASAGASISASVPPDAAYLAAALAASERRVAELEAALAAAHLRIVALEQASEHAGNAAGSSSAADTAAAGVQSSPGTSSGSVPTAALRSSSISLSSSSNLDAWERIALEEKAAQKASRVAKQAKQRQRQRQTSAKPRGQQQKQQQRYGRSSAPAAMAVPRGAVVTPGVTSVTAATAAAAPRVGTHAPATTLAPTLAPSPPAAGATKAGVAAADKWSSNEGEDWDDSDSLSSFGDSDDEQKKAPAASVLGAAVAAAASAAVAASASAAAAAAAEAMAAPVVEGEEEVDDSVEEQAADDEVLAWASGKDAVAMLVSLPEIWPSGALPNGEHKCICEPCAALCSCDSSPTKLHSTPPLRRLDSRVGTLLCAFSLSVVAACAASPKIADLAGGVPPSAGVVRREYLRCVRTVLRAPGKDHLCPACAMPCMHHTQHFSVSLSLSFCVRTRVCACQVHPDKAAKFVAAGTPELAADSGSSGGRLALARRTARRLHVAAKLFAALTDAYRAWTDDHGVA